MKLAYCLALIPLLFTFDAKAEGLEACDGSRSSQVEYMRCLDRQIGTLENQMKLWENNKLYELEELEKVTGRKDAIATFKKSVKSFATFADQHCRWQYVTLLPDTFAAARKYKECSVGIFHQRVVQLKKLSK